MHLAWKQIHSRHNSPRTCMVKSAISQLTPPRGFPCDFKLSISNLGHWTDQNQPPWPRKSKVQVFDTPQVVNCLRSNLMRLYFPVDLTGNLIMIEKLVLGGIWTGDLPIFNPDALTSAPSRQFQVVHWLDRVGSCNFDNCRTIFFNISRQENNCFNVDL